VSVVVRAGKNYSSAPSLDQAQPPGSAFAWRELCVLNGSNCTLTLDPRGVYRIRGGTTDVTSEDVDANGVGTGTYSTSSWRMLDSSSFQIAGTPRSQILRVHGSGLQFRIIGAVFVPVSLAYFVTGGLGLGGVFAKSDGFRYGFGLGFLGGGAAFLGVGAWALAKRTRVVDDSGRVLARIELPGGLELGPQGIAF
jgi:hypothetical protein